MSRPDSYAVDPAQLRDHANRLGQHADRVAKLGTSLPGELAGPSLGSFAQFITAGITTAMNRTGAAFDDTAKTLDTVGGALRRAADEYDGADREHAAGLTGIGDALEEAGR